MIAELIVFFMVLWIGFTIIRLVFYSNHILLYGRGMSVYRSKNWTGREEAYHLASAAYDEILEAIDAAKKGHLWEFFEELCDVNHALIMMVALLIFGDWLKTRHIYWILYMLAPMTAWKHADRFRRYRCIRSLNHHDRDGLTKNHICIGDPYVIAEFKSS